MKIRRVGILLIVSLIVCFNIAFEHIKVNSNTERISLLYYLSNLDFSIEFWIALTSFYPLVVVIVVLFYDKLWTWGLIIMALLGIVFTFLQFVLMHLHLDLKILEYNWPYYSIIASGTFSVFICLYCVLQRTRKG